MELKTIIYSSELEFRQYVIQNLEKVTRIIIFEDTLEQNIYFYCFTSDFYIVATKEPIRDGS